MDIKLSSQRAAPKLDLSILIDTRLLIQANSGGGKSWCIRRMLEQSHGKVQQIVIDLEGEFSTLREKYDYILAGKGGDTPTTPQGAGLLARRLLELNVSAIIDLYELNHFDRKRFVKEFLDSLVNAPKNLWHPCLVVLDEAHVFCPEKGQSEAMNSVIDLATRGRKRGFCAVLATQRLSKLHKDAAAECNNKLIGRTGLDVDMKRASEELGFNSKPQYYSLRALKAGEFFAFGPAISSSVTKFKIGDVKTTHPKAGSRIMSAPPTPPTNKIKNILSKLGDLPKEAEEEARTIGDYQVQNRKLKTELTRLKRKVEARTVPNEEIERVAKQQIQRALKRQDDSFNKILTKFSLDNKKIERFLDDFIDKSKNILSIIKGREEPLRVDHGSLVEVANPNPPPDPDPPQKWGTAVPINKIGLSIQEGLNNLDKAIQEDWEEKLPLAARKIYTFLAQNPDRAFSKAQIGGVTGYSYKSGGFNNALSKLSTMNLIKREGQNIQAQSIEPSLIDEQHAETYSPEIWFQKLPLAPKKIYKIVWDYPHDLFSKEQLGQITGYSHNSGGFNNALSKLNSLGLIRRVNGNIKLNEELLEV